MINYRPANGTAAASPRVDWSGHAARVPEIFGGKRARQGKRCACLTGGGTILRVYADSSFLASFYLIDGNFRAADKFMSTGGYRALDVLHVAAAITLSCSDFLTFDQRQAELGTACGSCGASLKGTDQGQVAQ
jgi:hypothetical protein